MTAVRARASLRSSQRQHNQCGSKNDGRQSQTGCIFAKRVHQKPNRVRPLKRSARGPDVKTSLPVLPTAHSRSGCSDRPGAVRATSNRLRCSSPGATASVRVQVGGTRTSEPYDPCIEDAVVAEQTQLSGGADRQSIVQALGNAGCDDDCRAVD